MKKFVLCLVLFLVCSLTACSEKNPTMDANAYTTSNVGATVAYSYEKGINTIEDIMDYSTNIVKAELVSIQDFNGAISEYLFNIVTDYTGNTPQQIHMYDAYNDQYKTGNTYFLFLCGTDTALYPHTIYTTVYKELIIDAAMAQASATLGGNEIVVETSEIDSVIYDGLQNSARSREAQPHFAVSTSRSVSAVSDEADIIAEISVSGEQNANKYASAYQVTIVNLLKGPDDFAPQYMTLPPDLDSSSTYYVFLKEDPAYAGTYLLSSRVYPVIETTAINADEFSLD